MVSESGREFEEFLVDFECVFTVLRGVHWEISRYNEHIEICFLIVPKGEAKGDLLCILLFDATIKL